MQPKPIQILCYLALSYLLVACAEFKETGRTIGHTTKDITTSIGHASRDAAKSLGKKTQEVVSDITEDEE